MALYDRNSQLNEYEFDALTFKDSKYIISGGTYDNLKFKEPVEINITENEEIIIRNCHFESRCIIRFENIAHLDSAFIFRSVFNGELKIYGNGNSRIKKLPIDSVAAIKLEIIGVKVGEINLYKTQFDSIYLEEISAGMLNISNSSIGVIYEQSTKCDSVTIESGTFTDYDIFPNNISLLVSDRFPDKSDQIEVSLNAIDLVLKNDNKLFTSKEWSELFYYRNSLSTQSLFHKLILWLFGYFHKPSRYLTSASIIIIFFSLLLVLISSKFEYKQIIEVLYLTTTGFIGVGFIEELSDPSKLESIIYSILIGSSTIFYSALLITLLNRFRVKL